MQEGYFHVTGRAGFDLRPHHLGAVAPAIGALGDEVVDAALAVLVARIPVLHGGILDLGIFLDDDLDHRGVQLVGVALRRGAALEVADIEPLSAMISVRSNWPVFSALMRK
jgi:hypothetical protein